MQKIARAVRGFEATGEARRTRWREWRGKRAVNGFWIKITATDEVDADQEWDYTVSILNDLFEVVTADQPAKNNWESLTLAGYQNASVTGLYEIPVDSIVRGWWGELEEVPTIYFSERNEPNCEPA